MRNHLVHAKAYPLIREKVSLCSGKSRCETFFNIQETDTFQSFVTKEVYRINRHFDWDSKCVIYLIYCKVCDLQYVESTDDKFRLWWNNYKHYQQIASEGGTPKKTTSISIFKVRTIMNYLMIVRTDPSDSTRRAFSRCENLKH